MIKNHLQFHHPSRKRMFIKNLHDLLQKVVTVKTNVNLVMTDLNQIQQQRIDVIVVVHHHNLQNIVEVQ